MGFARRALAHRSILCDPRRADMRDAINERVKLREPYRPFAPSVLREHMADWFEVDDDVPFMMKIHPIEPIVHRPEEALDCFLRTDMDVLVLGPYVVRKAPSGARVAAERARTESTDAA